MTHRVDRHLGAPHQIPEKPEEMSWTDYLILLLHIGAEIEHALMVEYLYAAYSLGGEHVPAEHRDKVRYWRNQILSVAREEMGHLLTVQNLLCLVGGPVSFDREDYPWDSPFYPFPFRLSPLTKESLEHFVFAEMPPDKEMRKAEKWQREVRRKCKKAVEGDNEEHHPVSEIYDAIMELVSDETKIPDSAFRPETYAQQASWDEWGRNYRSDPEADASARWTDERRSNVIVAQMATRTEAIAGLRAVAGQGEAPHLRGASMTGPGAEPSHFERFAIVYVGYEEVEKLKGKDRWNPVRDIPVNPTTVHKDSRQQRKGSTYIKNDTSRRWAELFNVRYRMLLNYLAHTYRLGRTSPGTEPSPRGLMVHRAFGEMYNLKTIAGILVRMPLDKPSDAKRAGPPFQMPYTLALPADEVDCWRAHQDLLESSAAICDDLAKGDGPEDGARYLTALRDIDAQSEAWIDQILAGMGSARRGRS